jgi:uncharacterized membrane protein
MIPIFILGGLGVFIMLRSLSGKVERLSADLDTLRRELQSLRSGRPASGDDRAAAPAHPVAVQPRQEAPAVQRPASIPQAPAVPFASLPNQLDAPAPTATPSWMQEPPEPAMALPAAIAPTPAPEPAPPPIAAPEPAAPAPAAPVLAVLPPPVFSPLADEAVAPPRVRPTRSRAEWESLIGGQLLNRVGALALIIGMGFFLKYAVDNQWISDTLKVLIGLLVGGGLFVAADRSHRKDFQIFAQGLLGAGVAILYLSVYAAFNFYHLVSQPLAVVMMTIVSLVAFSQAIAYDSLAIGLLSWAGGFLTPFLLSAGLPNELGLFSYLLLFDAGICAIVSKKRSWFILEPLTVLGSYITYAVWFSSFYTPDAMLLTALLLTLFWGLFYALHTSHVFDPATRYPPIRQLIAGLNGVFFYAALYLVVSPLHPEWMGLITLAIGLVYLGTWRGFQLAGRGTLPIHAQYAVMGVLFLALASRVQFEGFSLIIGWTLEALACIWYGTRRKLWYLWQPGIDLLGLAYVALFAVAGALEATGPQWLILNLRTLTFGLLVIGMMLSVRWFRQLDEPISKPLIMLLQYSWCILLLVLVTVETRDFFRQISQGRDIAAGFIEQLLLSCIWAAYALLLTVWSRRQKNTPMLHIGMATVGMAVAWGGLNGAAFQPIERFTLLFNPRTLALLLLQAAVFWQSRWLQDDPRAARWAGMARLGLAAVGALLLFELVTTETLDYFRHFSLTLPATFTSLGFSRSMTLAMVWVAYAAPMIALSLDTTRRPQLWSGVGAFGGAALLVIAAGSSYRPIGAFTPLLNLRLAAFLAVIGGGLALGWWLRRNRQRAAWIAAALAPGLALLLWLGFELITAETHDYFTRLMLDAGPAATATLIFQETMAMALVWLAYALPLVGAGRRALSQVMVYAGLIVFGCAALVAAGLGWAMAPAGMGGPLLLLRGLVFAAVIGGGLRIWFWLSADRQRYGWLRSMLLPAQVLLILILLELLSVETWDGFQQVSAGQAAENYLQQLALSLAWLVYSIGLLAFGIWRRITVARLMAIGLFGLTILKIFIYDLAFLPTLYRIFSFMGLGIILLSVSYLYQRYKHLILDLPPPEAPAADSAA